MRAALAVLVCLLAGCAHAPAPVLLTHVVQFDDDSAGARPTDGLRCIDLETFMKLAQARGVKVPGETEL